MSWRATGCCTNTLISGAASTSCSLASTGGTVSGEAAAPLSAPWNGSLSSTESQHFYPFRASLLSFPPSCSPNASTVSVWSQHFDVQTWNHIFWWSGFGASDGGFWFRWVFFALLGKVPPTQGSSNAHCKKWWYSLLWSSRRKIVRLNGPWPPVLLESQ